MARGKQMRVLGAREGFASLSRFRKSFNLNLLGVFLAFSSLGAGSNERTRTPLGAHQQRVRSQ